jgi:type IV fimbrial biogenesis protein FimT
VLNVFQTAMPAPASSKGFTLIELMIVVVIVALTLALGMPSYRTWVQNTQIYNAAESAQNGLQKAKAEAVKQNAKIEFVLGNNPPWIIKVAGGAVIERSTTEGAKNVSTSATPQNATTITFGNLGGVVTNADASVTLTQIDFTSPTLPSSRNLRVTIGVGGNVRMCDPNLATGSNPRAC